MVALTTGQFVRDVLMQVYNPREARYRLIDIQAMPLCRPGEDKPYRVYTVFDDVTERRRSDEALRESEGHFRLLHDTMLQGVVYHDVEGAILSMNPAAERILGKSAQEILGSTPVDVENDTFREDGSPLPGVEHPAMVALSTGQAVRDMLMRVYNPREATHRLISVQAIPLFGPGEDRPSHGYTVFDDVTARKRVEEELRATNEDLERFNRAMVGRELRMIELKREINRLCAQAGEPPRYTVDADEGAS